MDLPEMKNYLVIFLTLTLIACGPSQDEKEKIAAVSCAVMEETRNMDGAIRVREMNAAREKIGGEPFLRGDDAIKEAFEYGLCEELVLGGAIYDESLFRETEIERITTEKLEEEQRISWESLKEEKRRRGHPDSKPTVEESFHPNGELEKRTNYQSKDDGGKKHGLERLWHENGQLSSERTYKNGEQHGSVSQWYENGQLQLQQTLKNGKEQGVRKWWHENGQLQWEMQLKDGERQGFNRWWDENGQLLGENCVLNGEEVDMSNCQG